MRRLACVLALLAFAVSAAGAATARAGERCGLSGLLVCYIIGPASPRPPQSVGADGLAIPSAAPVGSTFGVAMRGFASSEYVSVWLYPPRGPVSDLLGGWAAGGRYNARWSSSYADPGRYAVCGQGQGTKRIACGFFDVTAGRKTAPTPAAPIAGGPAPPRAVSSGLATRNDAQTVTAGGRLVVSSGPFAAGEQVAVWLYVPGSPGRLLSREAPDAEGQVAGAVRTDKTGRWAVCLQGERSHRTGCTTTWVVPAAFATRVPTGTRGARLAVTAANLSRSIITGAGFAPGERVELWLGAGPTVTDQSDRSSSPVLADADGRASFTAQWYFEDPAGPFMGCLVGRTSGFAACGWIRRGSSILDS